MNQPTPMLRLAAATLAATLATTVMADNGKPSSASNRSNDSGARHLEHQAPETGGKLKPGHPTITAKGRPVTSKGSKKAPAFEADRAGRQNDAYNELEYLEIIRCSWEDPFGFSSDDRDADKAGRKKNDSRQVQVADAEEEKAKWESDDLSSDHANARTLQQDPMDINHNGIVDMQDFGLLVAAFGTAEHDLNGDGLVDGQDLGLILARMTPLIAVD